MKGNVRATIQREERQPEKVQVLSTTSVARASCDCGNGLNWGRLGVPVFQLVILSVTPPPLTDAKAWRP